MHVHDRSRTGCLATRAVRLPTTVRRRHHSKMTRLGRPQSHHKQRSIAFLERITLLATLWDGRRAPQPSFTYLTSPSPRDAAPTRARLASRLDVSAPYAVRPPARERHGGKRGEWLTGRRSADDSIHSWIARAHECHPSHACLPELQDLRIFDTANLESPPATTSVATWMGSFTRLVVPSFQRSLSWDEGNGRSLVDDLMKQWEVAIAGAASASGHMHLLGFTVLHAEAPGQALVADTGIPSTRVIVDASSGSRRSRSC